MSRRLVAGVFVASAVGIVDELIQGMTPGRYAQAFDAMMNVASAILGSVVAALARPTRLSDWREPGYTALG
jgi:VanZ family protein